jgi:two-component system CheB/CheR fusion protein
LSFPIVGVGASAGGLDAFRQMLSALPVDTGMGFVLVQHLSPTHASLLSEILGRTTVMPVTEVRDEPQVEPNHVYVIPPDRKMCIVGGGLRLLPREEHGQQRPVDYFLRSLGEDQGSLAIGVVLSGTGTDGTLGLEVVKAKGGITFAQDDSAQQGGMPRSAVASGCVDFVLSPEAIAQELGRIARHPLVARGPTPGPETPPEADGPELAAVLRLLRDATGVDFTQYKPNTFYRRITRRMVLLQIGTLQDYVRFLASDPAEAQALYQDVLINVTSFFRNPEVFEALQAKVFPALFQDRPLQRPIRVWVPGCSTGEEAYSLAIALAEHAEASGSRVPVQIFATDLNEAVIQKARKGVYPESIARDVTPERLERFFTAVDGHYRVAKTIREQCVFARHNLLADPPFSQLDLIGCRNFLIYLEPSTQRRIVPLLHYALKPDGFLVLGTSETASSYRDLFEVEDARHKIFRSKPGTRRLTLDAGGEVRKLGPRARAPEETAVVVQREAERILLAKYAPPSVVIDADLEIRQFRGDTGPYLAPAPGKASLNLLKMAREGLAVALRTAISKARKEEGPVRKTGLRVKSETGFREVHVEVIPLREGSGEGAFLVLFEDATPSAAAPAARPRKNRGKAAAEGEGSAGGQNDRLAEELRATREYLQAVIEQQEDANQSLQSAGEELQSANEELQSLNEELETSKEEIQSTNEELTTVNDELQNRNQELNQSTNDMINLLGSVDTAIVMLGPDLCIRRFTPAAEKILSLIPADLGRPIGHVKLTLHLPDLHLLLAEVAARAGVVEREVQNENGHWYLLRVRPYRTLDNTIDGAVIMLVDIDRLKALEETLVRRVEELATADRSKNEFLALLAHELRNPLAPLRNALNLIEVHGADGGVAGNAVGVMHRQIRNMVRLVDDLLDVSRITRGKVLLRKEPVELASLLGRALEVIQHQAEARGQQVTLSLPPEPVYLDADATRLEQIFGNLLHNASKFTPAGGHIAVIAELVSGAPPPGEIVVRVRDDGIGIDSETLPRVFDLFMQGQRSLDRSQGGLGIGLTLVRSLVELHGGTIEARSGGLGQGSELVVRLPLSAHKAPAPEEPVAAEVAVTTAAAGPVARRVLVVDDNVDTAESMALLLRLRGHEVEVAFSGPMALEMADAFEPGIVLLDIGLPGLDGYEVARELRRRPRLAKALLVALTGYGQETDRSRAREAGFDHHLTKPADPTLIYGLLESGSQPAL